jgi:type III restriction enzyme
VLEDLYDRLPIMVMNDEGHHCRSPAATEEDAATVEKDEAEEARVWLDGPDRINNCTANPMCLDLSATTFQMLRRTLDEDRPEGYKVFS